MAPKNYKLWTVKEISDVVTEKNIEGFLADFEQYLRVGLEVEKMSKLLTKEGNFLSEAGIAQISANRECFHWVDDGMVGVSKITMEVTSQEEGKPMKKGGPIKIKVKNLDEN